MRDNINNSNNNLPLISVIIPVYNIKNYISRCVESIIGQVDKCYEVILVDDGSTDGSSEVCDAYAMRFPQIRAVHKTNGGLSDARNYGVRLAKGSYITFVDGDDFVAPSYLAILREGLDLYPCNMSVLKLRSVSEKNIKSVFHQLKHLKEVDYTLIGQSEMAEMLLMGGLPVSACGKLISKDICLKFPFPFGVYNEDVAIIAEFYKTCGNCVLCDCEAYAYVARRGSITKSKDMPIKKAQDLSNANSQFEKICCSIGRYSRSALAFNRLLGYARLFSILERVSDDEIAARKMRADVIEKVRREVPLLSTGGSQWAQKMRFRLLSFSPRLYSFVFSIFEKIIKGL